MPLSPVAVGLASPKMIVSQLQTSDFVKEYSVKINSNIYFSDGVSKRNFDKEFARAAGLILYIPGAVHLLAKTDEHKSNDGRPWLSQSIL